ncbi:hypothetical protein C8F01DRAFT_1369695, partial [Mycena amicta]
MASPQNAHLLLLHQIPPNTERLMLEATYAALFPPGSDNRMHIYRQNDLFNDSVVTLDLPIPRTTLLIVDFECENTEDLKQILREPAFKTLPDTTVYSGEAIVKWDSQVKSEKDSEYECVFGIYKPPLDADVSVFERKVEEYVDGVVRLPACQKNFSKYIMWRQNLHLQADIHELGLRAADSMVVTMAVYKEHKNMLAIVNDPAVQDHIAKTLTCKEFPLHEDCLVFTAQGIKIE